VEGPHELRAGDIFLLCSDGLSGQVSDSEIGAVAGALPPEEACRFLVDLANLRGGPDNITVLIVRVKKTADPHSNGVVPALPTAARPAGAWPGRGPWWLRARGGGPLMPPLAILLHTRRWSGVDLFFFMAAACATGAGLAGLVAHYRRERSLSADADEPAK